jgi:hypothetical protein
LLLLFVVVFKPSHEGQGDQEEEEVIISGLNNLKFTPLF